MEHGGDGDANYSLCAWKGPKIKKEDQEFEIRRRINIIQTTALSEDQLGYWEESWRVEENCCYSDASVPYNTGVKKKKITKSKIICKKLYLHTPVLNTNNFYSIIWFTMSISKINQNELTDNLSVK